jgi:hypothetical protein
MNAHSAVDRLPVPRADLFPACKHFFPCDELVGAGSLRDAIGGVVMSLNAGVGAGTSTPQKLINPNAYSVGIPLQASNQSLVSGEWAAIGTKTVTVLVVADFGLLGFFGFGRSATGSAEIMVRGNSIGPTVSDGTNVVTATAITDAGAGVAYAAGCTFDFGGNAVSFQTDANNVYSANVAVAMSSGTPGAVTAITLPAYTSMAGIDLTPVAALYGAAMFVWDGTPPSDFSLAIPWMAKAWQRGIKTIYPGWIGMT